MHIKEGSLGSLSLPHLIMHSTERGVRVAPRVVAPGTPPLEPEDQSKIHFHPYDPHLETEAAFMGSCAGNYNRNHGTLAEFVLYFRALVGLFERFWTKEETLE